MAADRRIKSRADRLAAADRLAELRVELRDIVRVFGRHTFRDPAVFGGNRQLGESCTGTARSLQPSVWRCIELRVVGASTRSPLSP